MDFVIKNNVLIEYKGDSDVIEIPEGVTEIAEKAFNNKEFKTVIIPSSVKYIANYAFYDCFKLQIKISDLKAWLEIDFEEDSANPLVNLGSSLYLNDKKITDLEIPEGIQEIKQCTFSFFEELKSVTIPSSVKKISDYAFSGCKGLKKINITDLKSWLEIDFENVRANPLDNKAKLYLNENPITDLEIPEGTQEIKQCTFAFCSNLQSVTIPNSVKKIGSSAFCGCENLKRVNILDLKSWLEIDFEDVSANPLNNEANLYLNGNPITDLVIPEGISEIKKYQFYNCQSLESVTIPSSVKKIGDNCFSYCSNLKNLTIPNDVEFSREAFKFCNIENFTHRCMKIKNGFMLSDDETEILACANLVATTIIIPETVTKLKSNSFPKNLESIVIPDTVTEFESEDYAGIFSNCLKLKNVTLPKTMKKIPDYMFFNCQSLESIIIPEGVVEIGNNAFKRCFNLKNVEFPNTLEKFGSCAFDNCRNLKNITIPASVKYFDSSVFDIFKDSVINYLGTAKEWSKIKFRRSDEKSVLKKFIKVLQLEDLKKEKIKQIKTVGIEALLNSYSENIGVKQEFTKDRDVNLFVFEITDLNEKIFTFYLDSKTSNKKLSELNIAFEEIRANETDGTKVTVEKIKESVQKNVKSFSWSIKEKHLYGNEPIEFYINKLNNKEKDYYEHYPNITLNPEITVIEKSAFHYCNIEHLELSDNITEIQENAFSLCRELKSVKLPQNITSIPYKAFRYCEKLTSIEIPESVTEIGDDAFSNCESITEIKIPDGVTEIGERVFASCRNLSTLKISSSLCSKIDSSCLIETKIKDFEAQNFTIENYLAFSKDKKEILYGTFSSTKNVVIPNGVQTIKNSSFSKHKNLENIEIPESVTKIEDFAFATCSNLKNIKLPSKLKSIGESAFGGCENLESIEIPNSVTTIGKESFTSCLKLKNVKLSNKMKAIQEYLFQYCSNLELVEVPKSILSIGWNVFYKCPNAKIKYEGTKDEWELVKLHNLNVPVETN